MSKLGSENAHRWIKPEIRFDIPINTLQQSTLYKHFAYQLAHFLKNPSRFFMMVLMKSFKLSPGQRIQFSKNALIDGVIRGSFKAICGLIGLVGVVCCSPIYLLAGFIELIVQRYYPRYECHVADNEISGRHLAKAPSLLTRNCALVPNFVSHYNRLRAPDIRFAELKQSIRMGHTHQFICLQEVFNPYFQQGFIESLNNTHPYAIYNVAPNAFGLSSGLMILSQHPIVFARFIQPPMPLWIWIKNAFFPALNPEYFSNKGILMALIKNQDEYQIIVTAHLKSSVGHTSEETAAIENIRLMGLDCLNEEIEMFIKDVEQKFDATVKHVLLGGDLNVSNVQDVDRDTQERVRLQGHPIFTKFKAPALDSWLADFYHSDYGTEEYDMGHVFPGVCFDHAGVYHCHQQGRACQWSEQEHVLFDDQGLSKCSPSSDHAGISMIAKNR